MLRLADQRNLEADDLDGVFKTSKKVFLEKTNSFLGLFVLFDRTVLFEQSERWVVVQL